MNYNETKKVIDLSEAHNISELGLKITNVLDEEGAENKELYLNLGDIDLKQSQLLSIKALIETMQSKLAGIQTTSEVTKTSAIGLGLVVDDVNADTRPTFSETFKSHAGTETTIGNVDNTNPKELTSFSQLKHNSIGDTVTDTANLEEVEDENVQEETEQFLTEASKEDEKEEFAEDDNNYTKADSEAVANSDLFKSKEAPNIYEELSKKATPKEDINSALDVTFGTKVSGEDEDEEKISTTAPEPAPTIEDKAKEEELLPPVSPVAPVAEENHEMTETVEKPDDGKYVLLDTEGITPEGVELIKSNTSDLPTLYLTQTLRSGQTVSYEGNIFLVGDAHPGSEIIATGDVTVWGILGGIVHAGSKGNTEAIVRALKLNPIQLRIANLYSRRNDTVNVPFVQKSNEFTPEEARIENEQIVIYKTLRRED